MSSFCQRFNRRHSVRCACPFLARVVRLACHFSLTSRTVCRVEALTTDGETQHRNANMRPTLRSVNAPPGPLCESRSLPRLGPNGRRCRVGPSRRLADAEPHCNLSYRSSRLHEPVRSATALVPLLRNEGHRRGTGVVVTIVQAHNPRARSQTLPCVPCLCRTIARVRAIIHLE